MSGSFWWKHPAAAYAGPFFVFVVLLVLGPRLPIGAWEQPLRVVLLTAVLWLLSRKVIGFKPVTFLASVALGVVVFVIWVAPDVLWPDYRSHWLFQNAITGELDTTIPDAWRSNLVVLASRTIRAVILAPIIEELFWRGWLMRWLIDSNFTKVPLGAYAARSFWITALLFASEHGPYWEVGFVAGVAYNWWVIRTKSLADCILAHAVTNLVLSGYVIFAGRWEYWM